MIIAVDFDGTCVTHEFPKVGKDVGAVSVLKRLVKCGHRIILFTMRSNFADPKPNEYGVLPVGGGDYLDDAINWFKEHNIPLYGINENPDQKSWTSSPKPFCHIFIDDAALGCPLTYVKDYSERPFAYWTEIEHELGRLGYFIQQ